ncbi:MAG TPA: hypothetical protein VFS43_21755 [Polyangiaceae bacterium]|nr:hypothetical protein [Polyangiaceae bacterium]
MSNAIVIDGWAVRLEGGEPRVRDVDLGERAGLARPRDVRRAIRQALEDGALALAAPGGGGAHESAPPARRPLAWVEREFSSGNETEAFYLNEEGALVVLTRLRTKVAVQATQAVVMVFVKARRGELPGPAPAAPAEPAPGALMPDAAVRAAGRSIELALKTGKLTDEAASLKYAELARRASGYDVTAPVVGLSWSAALPPAIAGLKPGESVRITKTIDTKGYLSARAVGEPYGLSGQVVGRIARELGVFGKEGYGVWRKYEANDETGDPIDHWLYGEASVAALAPRLREEASRPKGRRAKASPGPKRVKPETPLASVQPLPFSRAFVNNAPGGSPGEGAA